jgi:DNA-binding NarL/FixJ family response regulator
MIDADLIRVVLVDDHALFSQSLGMALDSYDDIEILGRADKLAAGVALAARHHPDVVLMDYRQPDGDGIAGALRVKEVSPESKVVILTAVEDEAVLAAAIEAGCAGFLTKTASVEELIGAVRQAAAGEAVISPALLVRLLPRLHRREQPTRFELTPRELDVLRLLATGMSNAAIAEDLTLSVNTVRNHVANLLMKLGVHSKLEALSVAVREGLVAPR